MPFTISHAAAVLPFRRLCPRVFIFPALVFGSFAPDFGYFIHLWDLGALSHTLIGSFVCDIPIALIMLALFCKCRPILAALLPSPHQEFWTQWSGCNLTMTPKTVLILSVSALVGAWTHIIWDSFTHSSGWCVLAAPALAAPVTSLYGLKLPAFKILQYVSSIVGLLVMGIFYSRQLASILTENKKENAKKLVRLGVLVIASLSLSALYTFWPAKNHEANFSHVAFLLLVNTISIFITLFFATALTAWRQARKS